MACCCTAGMNIRHGRLAAGLAFKTRLSFTIHPCACSFIIAKFLHGCDVHVQVTDIAGDVAAFDVIVETLRATNLGALQIGSPINFERSARVGDEIGGHNVSGHIATTATVASIEETPDNRTFTFKVAQLYPGPACDSLLCFCVWQNSFLG